MTAKKRIPRAFTLIELLVVIAIIAILAAILFPVFARARDKARQAACMSNQKQIGTALLQYNQDYDELLPQRYGGGCNLTTGVGDCENRRQRSWKNMLMPYVKSYAVYKCPSNPTSDLPDSFSRNGLEVDPTNTAGIFPAGYAMWLPDGPLVPYIGHGAEYPQPLAGIESPANSLLIVENSYRAADTGPNLSYREPAPNNDRTISPGPSTWNSGHSKNRGNIIYMDGHVKYMYLSKTFEETTPHGGVLLNQWRFNEAEVTAKGRGWLMQLRNDLRNYKND